MVILHYSVHPIVQLQKDLRMKLTIAFLFVFTATVAFSSEKTKPASVSSPSTEEAMSKKEYKEYIEKQESKAHSNLLSCSWKEISSDDGEAANGSKSYTMTLTFFSDKVIMEMETPADVVTTDIIPLNKLGADKIYLNDGKIISYSIKDGKLLLDYGNEGIDKFIKVKRSKNAEEVNEKKAKVIFSMANRLRFFNTMPA